jgi:protein kinase X
MSANAVDVVKRLLDPNPETRLGCRKFGPAEIKEHPFFTREINFQLLSRQKEEPPVSWVFLSVKKIWQHTPTHLSTGSSCGFKLFLRELERTLDF